MRGWLRTRTSREREREREKERERERERDKERERERVRTYERGIRFDDGGVSIYRWLWDFGCIDRWL